MAKDKGQRTAKAGRTLKEIFLFKITRYSVLALIAGRDSLPVIIRSKETDRSVEVLVHETGAAVCALDPLTSGPEDSPLDYYETVMLRNMELLQSALR